MRIVIGMLFVIVGMLLVNEGAERDSLWLAVFGFILFVIPYLTIVPNTPQEGSRKASNDGDEDLDHMLNPIYKDIYPENIYNDDD